MYTKFGKHGKGSAKLAEIYTLQTHDSKGDLRAGVELLRGNPSMVSDLADSLTFKHRYTSGVIAWHPDDNPSDEQIAEVLDDFERLAFAGLQPNQYTYYAVLHEEDNGAKHVHLVIPRVELQSGKSLNVAPPQWEKIYEILDDKHNAKHGWASVKELHRRVVVDISGDIHLNMSHAEAKRLMQASVGELVAVGSIKNEDDVIKHLNSIEGVEVMPRRSKKTLSVRVEGIKKNIRLEGLAYGRGFDAAKLAGKLKEEQERRARETSGDRASEAARVSRIFDETVEKRISYNQERYPKTEKIVHDKELRTPTYSRANGFSVGVGHDAGRSQNRPIPLHPIPGGRAKRKQKKKEPTHSKRDKKRDSKLRPAKSREEAWLLGGKVASKKQQYQVKLLIEIYKKNTFQQGLQGYWVERNGYQGATISNPKKGVRVEDRGEEVVGSGDNIKEEARLMIEVCLAKGWKIEGITFTGRPQFVKEAKRQAKLIIREQENNDRIRTDVKTRIDDFKRDVSRGTDELIKILHQRDRESSEPARPATGENTVDANVLERIQQELRRIDQQLGEPNIKIETVDERRVRRDNEKVLAEIKEWSASQRDKNGRAPEEEQRLDFGM